MLGIFHNLYLVSSSNLLDEGSVEHLSPSSFDTRISFLVFFTSMPLINICLLWGWSYKKKYFLLWKLSFDICKSLNADISNIFFSTEFLKSLSFLQKPFYGNIFMILFYYILFDCLLFPFQLKLWPTLLKFIMQFYYFRENPTAPCSLAKKKFRKISEHIRNGIRICR